VNKPQTIDEILNNLGASNVPETDGKYSEVDPTSIEFVKSAILEAVNGIIGDDESVADAMNNYPGGRDFHALGNIAATISKRNELRAEQRAILDGGKKK